MVLVGPMGSGKSSVGRALATALSLDHVDTDELVERHTGATIAALFAGEGEEAFRRRESEALHLAFAGSPKVISTGGGIVTTVRNRELLAGNEALVVWLDAELDTLVERVGDGTGRPLLAGTDVKASLAEKVASRADHYAAVADLRLDTTGRSCDDIVTAIVAELDLEVRA